MPSILNLVVRRQRLILGALLFFLAAAHSVAAQQEWIWKDGKGVVRTRAELDEILKEHALWISDERKGKRADLSGANLSGAELCGSLLQGSNLRSTVLNGATLRRAQLGGADLTFAELRNADLTDADLNTTDLHSVKANHALFVNAYMGAVKLNFADLSDANVDNAYFNKDSELDGVHLDGATFDRAVFFETPLVTSRLQGAKLAGARLDRVRLEGLEFTSVDLRGVIFEPLSNPIPLDLVGVRNLELVTYDRNPGPLTQLRKTSQDVGFRSMERAITCALNRRQAELDGPAERWFKRVAFDWTCHYGANPGRTLKIWSVFLLIFWVVYVISIYRSGQAGLYRVEKVGEVGHEESKETKIRRENASVTSRWFRWFGPVWRELRVFLWALFYSLMSAFNIGFRDINFGRWLRLLPPTEFDIKAKGWARTASGFQSLISVYLIALWVLTYFGRPFE